jgi:hypothetical protein
LNGRCSPSEKEAQEQNAVPKFEFTPGKENKGFEMYIPMDDSGGGGGNLAKGMDVGHNIVSSNSKKIRELVMF